MVGLTQTQVAQCKASRTAYANHTGNQAPGCGTSPSDFEPILPNILVDADEDLCAREFPAWIESIAAEGPYYCGTDDATQVSITAVTNSNGEIIGGEVACSAGGS